MSWRSPCAVRGRLSGRLQQPRRHRRATRLRLSWLTSWPRRCPLISRSSRPEPLAPVPASPQEELVEITDSLVRAGSGELEQVDFFIEQELYDDAMRMLDGLQREFPDDPEVAERRLVLKAKGAAARRGVGGSDEASEELFADEEDYFDLAKELEEELAREEAMVEEATGRGKDEAELEEVFREFQKGVAEQLSEEDSDTHFNLGIAYKEMGLLPGGDPRVPDLLAGPGVLRRVLLDDRRVLPRAGHGRPGGGVVPQGHERAGPERGGRCRAALRPRFGARMAGDAAGVRRPLRVRGRRRPAPTATSPSG